MLLSAVLSETRGLFLRPVVREPSANHVDPSDWLFKCIAENFPDVLSIHDGCGRYVLAFGQVERLLGWQANQLEGGSLFDFVHPDDVSVMRSKWQVLLSGDGEVSFRYRSLRPNGDYRWMEGRARVSADGESVMVTTRDVHHDIEQQRQLERDASYDALTNVLNRRVWTQTLQAEWQRCERKQQPVSIALLDIDNFKTVNDRHGHQAGDALLQNLTAAINSHKRAYDLLGRLGGDEFVLLLPQTNIEEAKHIMQRLLQCLSEQLPGVGVSFGISCSSDALNVEELLAQADTAMYRSKRLGGNRVLTWLKAE